jgi:hypothetical protein
MKLSRFFVATMGMVVIFNFASLAQSKYYVPEKKKLEFGIFLGGSNYAGDLEEDLINVNHTKFGYGAMVRYNFSNRFSLRFGLDWGSIADEDATAADPVRRKRNLSFRSSIFAGYIGPEVYLAHWRYGDKKYVSPYLFAGLGAYHFNPQAYYMGTWYDLRGLGTEGQGTLEYPDRQPYALNQLYIPFGGGFRITLSNTWFVNIETRAAKTFTDYLDDVSSTYASPDVLEQYHGPIAAALGDRSDEVIRGYKMPTGGQRGDPKHFDMFFFTGITVSHYFINKHSCLSF